MIICDNLWTKKTQSIDSFFRPQISTDWHRLRAKGSEDWKIERLKVWWLIIDVPISSTRCRRNSMIRFDGMRNWLRLPPWIFLPLSRLGHSSKLDGSRFGVGWSGWGGKSMWFSQKSIKYSLFLNNTICYLKKNK